MTTAKVQGLVAFAGQTLSGYELDHIKYGVAQLGVDKGFEPDTIAVAAEQQVFGAAMNAYFLGNETGQLTPSPLDTSTEPGRTQLDQLAPRIAAAMERTRPEYQGSQFEQAAHLIATDTSRRFDPLYSPSNASRRGGVNRNFVTARGITTSAPGLEDVPIAIVGAGAAGTLTARALVEAGFSNVDIYDKRGRSGGIWEQNNVHGGSRNNPVDLHYDWAISHAATVGDPTGREIQDYIQNVATNRAYRYALPPIIPGVVKEIEAGDLSHQVRFTVEGEQYNREYPIVVYAPGIGLPLPPSHPGHMETDAKGSSAGQRWQRQLTDQEIRDSGTTLLIGLGNSTAEMMTQFYDFTRRTGEEVDYRVLTHYPKAMVDRTGYKAPGWSSQVARDPTKPELTKLAMDLPLIKAAYRDAFARGKIIPGVAKWHVGDRGTTTVVDGARISKEFEYDTLYTLIGYGHRPDTLEAASVTVLDPYLGQGAFDFDGEVQQNPGMFGRQRVYPGYFGIGPVTKNRENPNALVIPGIQAQIAEMMPTLALRAVEYALRNPAALVEAGRTRQQPVRSTRAHTLESVPNLQQGFEPYTGAGSTLLESILNGSRRLFEPRNTFRKKV